MFRQHSSAPICNMESTEDAPTYEVPPSLLKSCSETQQQLLNHSRILHLLNHRSKNQHKRSLWYRHLSIFRREVISLTKDLDIELGPGFSSKIVPDRLSKAHEKRKAGATRSAAISLPSRGKVTERLSHWISSQLISRCYTAFSTLASTPSFSPLALSLLATLARICSLTGITAHLQALGRLVDLRAIDEDEEQLTEALERFAQEDAGELFDPIHVDATSAGIDVGMPMKRILDDNKPASPPKKRRKKTNVIDDLFDGL